MSQKMSREWQNKGPSRVVLDSSLGPQERELLLSPLEVGGTNEFNDGSFNVECVLKSYQHNADPTEQMTTTEYGAKTIRFWGGVMLLINNVAGPTVSLMPGLTQQAGSGSFWFCSVCRSVGFSSVGSGSTSSFPAPVPDNVGVFVFVEIWTGSKPTPFKGIR